MSKEVQNQRLAVIEKSQALSVLSDKLNKNLDELGEYSLQKVFQLEELYIVSTGVLGQLFMEEEYGVEEFLDRNIRLTKKVNKKVKKAIKKYKG